MKTKYVSIKSAISNWLEDTGTVEVKPSVLKRWAISAVEELTFSDQLTHRVALLDLENYRAELPEEFKLACEVSYKQYEPKEECATTEKVVQWIQDATEECQLEINLICNNCKEVQCNCDKKIIEVDVDRINEAAHPEFYYKHFHKVRHWGDGSSTYNPGYQLMRPFGDKFRSQHLPNCRNISCNSDIRYSIEGNMLESNVEKGEILLSYLGYKTDEEGYIMIPDHRAVFEAIFFFMEYKWFWKEWRRTGQNSFRTRYRDAKTERIDAIGTARSALEIPDFDDFAHWINESWFKRLPGDMYDNYGKFLGTP